MVILVNGLMEKYVELCGNALKLRPTYSINYLVYVDCKIFADDDRNIKFVDLYVKCKYCKYFFHKQTNEHF